MRAPRLWFLALFGYFCIISPVAAFSSSPNGGGSRSSSESSISETPDRTNVALVEEEDVATRSSVRRDLLWKIPLIGVGAVAYSNILLNVVRPSIVYPQDHERRVSATIATALEGAARSRKRATSSIDAPLRVLEIGVGKDCRLIRRGLYDTGLLTVASRSEGKVQKVEITGIDLQPPNEKALQSATEHLASLGGVSRSPTSFQVNVQVSRQSITKTLDVPDGYFDCVLSCLTLCSVDDPRRAVEEVDRVLRPDGGTFGYVEHVAVNPDEPYRYLELQQTALDPLQQLLADNCHLHRYTETTIGDVFRPTRAIQVEHERFLVNDMWPVTCQCCGVYQRTG